jgi:hypothetical protein
MKCGTSAVHSYLDAHPDIAMAPAKELNFFSGPERAPHDDTDTWWRDGQWHRGVDWYAAQLAADAPLCGESSPGYTSPTEHRAAARMASVVPAVRLVYLVRDPIERALSQYAHHRRDGTEPRPVAAALLDPGSQYLSRSRYHERLAPYLRLFPREQLHVVVAERLLAHRRREMSRVYAHVGADPGWADGLDRRVHVAEDRYDASPSLRAEFWEHVGDDVRLLRELLGDELPEWSPCRPPRTPG